VVPLPPVDAVEASVDALLPSVLDENVEVIPSGSGMSAANAAAERIPRTKIARPRTIALRPRAVRCSHVLLTVATVLLSPRPQYERVGLLCRRA
jgi:hypothetical protein